MKPTKGQTGILMLGFASVAALMLFSFMGTIREANGALVLKPQDWTGLGLVAVWLVGGGWLLKRLRRPK